MIATLKKYINVTAADADERRRATLLNILLAGMGGVGILALIALTGMLLLHVAGWENLRATLLSAIIFLSGIFLIFRINRRGYTTLASSLFLVLLTLAFMFANLNALATGATTFYFVIPVMIASVLIRPYASFIAAGTIGTLFILVGVVLRFPTEFYLGPLGLLAIALVSWLSARSLERALQEVRQINQELDQRVLDRTHELAEANIQLENQARELAQANLRLEKQTHELSEANTKLKSLDRLKSKFVADVTHELRTPISNLKIYVEMLQVGNPERRERYIAVLQEEITRLATLVEDILDLTRMELGTKKVEFKWVDFGHIIEQVVIANRPRAETKGLHMLHETDTQLPPIWGDAIQLAQLMTNLIGNAVNYTQTGLVKVVTKYDMVRNEIEVSVQDTGFGISEEDIPHLFERFYRGIRASQSDIPGTGLGLAITKEIVELHRGRIEVHSQVDVGSTFSVCLPTDKPEALESQP